MIRLESHCHSCYSHDSSLSISNIIVKCLKYHIGAIIICDHDVYGLTEADEKEFENNHIILLKGVEFTTREGVHIIGVSDKIIEVIGESGKYSVKELVDVLKRRQAIIIIPHPCHETGLLGNSKVSQNSKKYALENANFIEKANYRYGNTKDIYEVVTRYPNLRLLVGSDAHSRNTVGAYYNEIEIDEFNLANISDITCVKRKSHTNLDCVIKKVKKTRVYQDVLCLFPINLRKRIKNYFLNR